MKKYYFIKQPELVQQFNEAIQNGLIDAAMEQFETLKIRANGAAAIAEAVEPEKTNPDAYLLFSNLVADAQQARIALRLHGVPDDLVFPGCDF